MVFSQSIVIDLLLQNLKIHLGGDLNIPLAVSSREDQFDPLLPSAASSLSMQETSEKMKDPFDGLPFRAFAERLGESIMPAIEAARKEQISSSRRERLAADSAVPNAPQVPHFLPFTRWAAQSERIRGTFVADDSSSRRKARLSWYHPEDTMVPRDWFKGGLLEDIKYYNPFGIWGNSK